MNNDANYKTKYQELKLKFINSVDTAWRLGYENGLQAAQLQNAQQQLQQSQVEKQAAAGANQAPGQLGEAKEPTTAQETQKESNPSQHPEGSELDQHIAELEGMLGKSEISQDDLRKVLDNMKLQKNEVKPINVPHLNYSIPNMDNSSKKALKIQGDIVKNVMSLWEDEEKRMSKDITNTLNFEGLTRKE